MNYHELPIHSRVIAMRGGQDPAAALDMFKSLVSFIVDNNLNARPLGDPEAEDFELRIGDFNERGKLLFCGKPFQKFLIWVSGPGRSDPANLSLLREALAALP